MKIRKFRHIREIQLNCQIQLFIKMPLNTLLVTFLPLFSLAACIDRCPDGWMEAHGVDLGCIFFSHPKDHKSHDDATAYCLNEHEEVSGLVLQIWIVSIISSARR